MDVICRIAFGLNVNSQKEENNKFIVMMNKIFQGNNTPMNLMIAIFCEFKEKNTKDYYLTDLIF